MQTNCSARTHAGSESTRVLTEEKMYNLWFDPTGHDASILIVIFLRYNMSCLIQLILIEIAIIYLAYYMYLTDVLCYIFINEDIFNDSSINLHGLLQGHLKQRFVRLRKEVSSKKGYLVRSDTTIIMTMMCAIVSSYS